MEENKLLLSYVGCFKDLPPSCMMITYEHPIYQKLMRVAIDLGEEITIEQLEKELEENHIEYDCVDEKE